MKKGQVTVFIIISILIVFAGILVFLLINPKNSSNLDKTSEELQSLSREAQSVRSFVSDCIDESIDSVLYEIGQHGGRFLAFPNSHSIDVNYVRIISGDIAPNLDEIEKEISDYLETEIYLCAGNIIEFTQVNVTAGEITSKIVINDDSINFNIDYSINVREFDTSSSFSEFNRINRNRLGLIYLLSEKMVRDFEESEDGSICISCILSEGAKNDLFVDTVTLDEKTIFVVIRDPNYLIKDFSYEFKFLMMLK